LILTGTRCWVDSILSFARESELQIAKASQMAVAHKRISNINDEASLGFSSTS
jgi:hypothetical protein